MHPEDLVCAYEDAMYQQYVESIIDDSIDTNVSDNALPFYRHAYVCLFLFFIPLIYPLFTCFTTST